MSLKEILDIDILMGIASYTEAGDLVSLALSCKHFGSKQGTASDRDYRKSQRDAKRQKKSDHSVAQRDWSLMEEVARCTMEKEMTAIEHACLPLRDGYSWLQRLHEWHMLRKPLEFDQLAGYGESWSMETKIYHHRNTKAHVSTYERGYYLALSDHVMRGGKHFANFTSTGFGSYVRVGVMRPIKNCERKGITNLSLTGSHDDLFRHKNESWGDGVVNMCTYNLHDGICQWSDWDRHPHPEYYGHSESNPKMCNDNFTSRWEGMEGLGRDDITFEERDRLDVAGLLLDLDEGTLTVYKNGTLLGVMKTGLDGVYCWCVDFYCGYDDGPGVKIERGTIPT